MLKTSQRPALGNQCQLARIQSVGRNLLSYDNSDLNRKFLFYQMNVCVCKTRGYEARVT